VNENQTLNSKIGVFNASLAALLRAGQQILGLAMPKLQLGSGQHSSPFQVFVADSNGSVQKGWSIRRCLGGRASP